LVDAAAATAQDFNPEMYNALCRVFSKTYAASGTPINILAAYLSTLTTGACTVTVGSDEDPEAGRFDIDEHDRRIALLATPLKGPRCWHCCVSARERERVCVGVRVDQGSLCVCVA